MAAVMNAVQAYRQVGQQGISSDRLVLMGLEGILEYLRRADLAIREKRIAEKAEAMDKAYQLTAHLLASVDHERGGEIATNLESLYRFVLEKLALANIFDDLDALASCRPVLEDLRDGWRGLLERS
ncbi:flagellar export chaperone FliS [Acidithiobacillus sp. CV18-2]|uniref:Flagellar export chaperone FliS n=1 Tax=Igneacidithiobacillus copahuensis TaxID=2724909 RepID=A0AAE2YNN4_9PROT|nr:flagellar export chaperone FliS [Igneacidithiobacillus copahuensis]MBU2754394.1 flagellar export chaperone FliS [Acidithiobacillus sp. CV18-3]MBU2757583.1 flagellar export chaperone FliS [Acidithiobacillus sp. BN09-2]MBU2777102.1 flagellar export chaperone FliS [Acidithiobacillus sp. CV18-2]MBU2797415.1 flagellar export chaperone FliS [Acidithiobacillus sp. VAN18-2]MBU2799747.1 flagellar export chaperone FliS [Acidithiobacillus sp. VAN18-4]UTV81913.1 flagellar export chaperone FliS [Acidit